MSEVESTTPDLDLVTTLIDNTYDGVVGRRRYVD
jgi:hypothetical protein